MHGQILNLFSQSNICQSGDFRRKRVTPVASELWNLFTTINIITISDSSWEIQASKNDPNWGLQHFEGICYCSLILLMKMFEFEWYFLSNMFQIVFDEVSLFQKSVLYRNIQETNFLFNGAVSDRNSELFMGCLVNVLAQAGNPCSLKGKLGVTLLPQMEGKIYATSPSQESNQVCARWIFDMLDPIL